MKSHDKALIFDPSENLPGGAARAVPGKSRLEGCGVVLPRDIAELEEALVRCHELWRRSPGGGGWPFAGDGPWHLIRAEQGDYVDSTDSVIEGKDGALRDIRVPLTRRPRVPLDAAEVAERDAVTGWLQLVADVDARAIVWAAGRMLHRGEGRVEWGQLKRELGYPRTPRRMAGRYREAMAEIVCRLQGWPLRRARVLAG